MNTTIANPRTPAGHIPTPSGASTWTHVAADQPTRIDMLNPAQVAAQLQTNDAGVLDLVNSGRLAAYNLGGAIRFKTADVAVAARLLLAA